jgi:hypothetical protein
MVGASPTATTAVQAHVPAYIQPYAQQLAKAALQLK